MASVDRNIRLTLEYDGTDFVGWQRQPNGPSIQEAIEEALEEVTNSRVRLTAAGRTDAGVHAQGQVANFHTSSQLPLKAFCQGLNARLPADIAVTSANEVPLGFNARRHARLRWYRYHVLNRPVRPARKRRFVLHYPFSLNGKRLAEATSLVQGDWDFRAFRSAQCTATRTRLRMVLAGVTRQDDLIVFDFKCRSFLQHMVRFLVGTLLEVGRGRIDTEVLRRLLSGEERPCTIPAAPSQGLVLMKVFYADDLGGDRAPRDST